MLLSSIFSGNFFLFSILNFSETLYLLITISMIKSMPELIEIELWTGANCWNLSFSSKMFLPELSVAINSEPKFS